jgi:hypothetical protein
MFLLDVIKNLMIRWRLTGALILILGAVCIPPASAISTPQSIPMLQIAFQCPTYPISAKFPIVLYADIFGPSNRIDQSRLVFSWKLSEGEIRSGQGTRRLEFVAKTETSRQIDVNLNVDGAPPDLAPEVSCRVTVDPNCSLAPLADQYSNITFSAEQSHLDRLAAKLASDSKSILYLVSYGGRNSCIYETRWRAERAQKYLVEQHKTAANRVIIVEGGFRESWSLEFYIGDKTDCGPLPAPTLNLTQVNVRGQCQTM